MCSRGGADFYALPYDYFQFDLPAANLLRRAVSFGFAATPVVGAVSECVDTTGTTHSGNPGGPYAGEFNATLGALRQAGHPAASIVTLATPAAAAARTDYQVLLFMEQENCAPPAAPWVPIVNAVLARGGRVVATTSRSGTGAFINALGVFGTGAVAAVSAPYATDTASPFWTGITHPGDLNATDGWTWSGPGLVRLGWDAGTTTALTVWGYNVP
jgi:hypothetical protein